MTEQEKRALFCAKTGRVATSATVEYQAFLFGLESNLQKTERNAAFDGDTCGRQCEGTAYRIEARQQKRRADTLAVTIRALQDVVTHDAETKADFIARVRAVLAADPDERLAHNASAQGPGGSSPGPAGATS